MSILDFVFPKKCINCRKFGEFICDNCFSKIKFNENYICPICFRTSVNGMTHPYCCKRFLIDGVVSGVVYGSVIKKLVYQFKYEPNLSKLSQILGRLMSESLSQNESFYEFVVRHNPVIVPIPLSARRMRVRGYNHAELLASYVAQYFRLNINSELLVRLKNTKPQYKLGRKERLANIEGAFAINTNPKSLTVNTPYAVILVDDLATTFSTLAEATKILKKAGVKKVIGATLAREA